MKKLVKQIEEYVPYDEKEKTDKEAMLNYMKKNKDVFSRNNMIAHMTTSAWVVNKERTKVLMIFHNIYNSWAWVGGHADEDENLFQVVQREVEEETGIKKLTPLYNGIYGLNIITVENHIKRGKQVNSHLHFDIEYLFEADEKDNIRIKEDENSNVGWVPIDEVENYSSEEHMKPIYHRLNEKLNSLDHQHSIIVIKDKEKYLQYFDKNWNCYLFPNTKGDIKKYLKEKFNIETKQVKKVKNFIHKKYSESHKEERVYLHTIYKVTQKNKIESDKIKWFTLEELEKDEKIQKINKDIIDRVKETI